VLDILDPGSVVVAEEEHPRKGKTDAPLVDGCSWERVKVPATVHTSVLGLVTTCYSDQSLCDGTRESLEMSHLRRIVIVWIRGIQAQ
jgi:hypothetical protein